MKSKDKIKHQTFVSVMYILMDLTGKILLWLSGIFFFSVFLNTMAYENTQKMIFISHQFGIYITFAIHMTSFYDSKARNWVVIKYQLLVKELY